MWAVGYICCGLYRLQQIYRRQAIQAIGYIGYTSGSCMFKKGFWIAFYYQLLYPAGMFPKIFSIAKNLILSAMSLRNRAKNLFSKKQFPSNKFLFTNVAYKTLINIKIKELVNLSSVRICHASLRTQVTNESNFSHGKIITKVCQKSQIFDLCCCGAHCIPASQ